MFFSWFRLFFWIVDNVSVRCPHDDTYGRYYKKGHSLLSRRTGQGLKPSDAATFNSGSVFQCATLCKAVTNCMSFSYSFIGNDAEYPTKPVCYIYNETSPDKCISQTPEDQLQVIFCSKSMFNRGNAICWWWLLLERFQCS